MTNATLVFVVAAAQVIAANIATMDGLATTVRTSDKGDASVGIKKNGRAVGNVYIKTATKQVFWETPGGDVPVQIQISHAVDDWMNATGKAEGFKEAEFAERF